MVEPDDGEEKKDSSFMQSENEGRELEDIG